MQEWIAAYPVCSAEIDSFSKVVPLVEATVVGSGEGDDELPGTLVGAHHLRGKDLDGKGMNR